ncbi:TrmH family RNA methyltransferase [Leeuwenhoekiella sp. A16]|uniref:TrmH family RNA methyltransferase n=1 Tax=unclassified Leeuwenhoekiella TaxID=2615029 RepID=UPI003A8021A2
MNKELLQYLESFLTQKRVDLFKQVASQRTNHFTVVNEDVRHLHNTSAVIRSCDAFGVQNVHVIEEKIGRRIDKEIAMGAQKWTTVNRYNNVHETIENLKKDGYRIVATTPHHQAHTLQDFNINTPAALFFGREAEGLSDAVINEADDYIYIPTSGFTHSLNISVSAAIILQNLMQRLQNSSVNWQLSPKEQIELRLQWAKRHMKNYDELVERFMKVNKLYL